MVVLKTPGEIGLMDEANRIVHRVLDGIGERIEAGVTAKELDTWAENTIRAAGGVPAFLNYRGFPATLCTSVNDVVIHGIPNSAPLEIGDIIGVDCGVLFKGYFGDAARTYRVGTVSPEAEQLLQVTRDSLECAVEQMQPGSHLSDIGHAVQEHVESHGYSVVRDFTGHGIGVAMHESPNVPNYGRPGRGPRLRPGMVLAVEPMVNAGAPGVKVDADGWTARTEDGSLSAHFEYSIAVTEDGPRVLGVAA